MCPCICFTDGLGKGYGVSLQPVAKRKAVELSDLNVKILQ